MSERTLEPIFSQEAFGNAEYLAMLERGEGVLRRIREYLPEWRRLAKMAGIQLHEGNMPATIDDLINFEHFDTDGCYTVPKYRKHAVMNAESGLKASFAELERDINDWANEMWNIGAPHAQA